MSNLDGWYRRERLALLTDFYEVTMMAAYWRTGRLNQQVSFDYFFRNLPPHAGFAVAAGLASFLDYLEHLRFEKEDIAYLASLNLFEKDFLAYLEEFRPNFTVRAVPEGTVVFPYEPLMEVEGNIIECQLVETALLNFLNYQTLIATKAARICLATEGEPVMEFGLRRAHGPDGGLSGSRAAYIGGCTSTSNLLAGKVYGIPVSGTHAHSWVMSYESELEAFRDFAEHYAERCVLLVDTYDTLGSGVPNAIQVYRELRARGREIRPAIRLDSGDLAKLSKKAHAMLVEAGFDDPLIVASNDLDEDLIADLKRQGAKINSWGVGTHLITAYDAPALSGVYKLVAVQDAAGWQPRIKITANIEKSTDPGRKQVWRYFDANGAPLGDVLRYPEEQPQQERQVAACSRTHPHRESRLDNCVMRVPLLEEVFSRGQRRDARPAIQAIRQRTQRQISSLPDEYKRLRNPEIYRVLLSPDMAATKERLLAAQASP